MLNYLDRTFCPFYINCKLGNVCHRALTNQHKENARQMDLYISQFVYEPPCFEYRPDIYINWPEED